MYFNTVIEYCRNTINAEISTSFIDTDQNFDKDSAHTKISSERPIAEGHVGWVSRYSFYFA